MRLLLDTNIVIPAVQGRASALEPDVRDAISATDATIFVSVASLWEIAIKVRLGKLPLSEPLSHVPDLIAAAGYNLLLIDVPHVLAEVVPLPDTRDPFDRLLLAQCQVENLRLMTLDRVLAAHPLAWQPARKAAVESLL